MLPTDGWFWPCLIIANSKTNWKRVAQETALKILNVHPNALIFVEGVEIYPEDHLWDEEQVDTRPWTGIPSNYFGNWWGGNLRGVEKYPIDLGKFQSQLVYSPHDYGPTVYQQPWFKAGYTYESLYNDCWRDNWMYIYENKTAPLLIGEWGGYMNCLLYTSPSPRDRTRSRMPSSA